MKFNFRKVIPVVTGALLLGSTIGFAVNVAGADSTYPGSFADSIVVIGSASADSAAANDIAADLGKLTTSSGSTSVSDGHLLKKGSEVLNYGENFTAIDSKLDDSDLPTLLTAGNYKDTKGTNDNDEEYDQFFEWADGGNKLVYEADENNDDKRGSYLKLTDGVVTYNYSLVFTTGPKYDNSTATKLKEDFELTRLNILGEDWTIIDASASSLASGPNKLTLMGGAASTTVKTGETANVVFDGKSYSVTAQVYSSKVQFTINGESISVDEGGTDELADGVVVGVTEISTSSKEAVADQATFFLGARKLVLEHGKKVELNGEDLDGTTVYISDSTATSKLKAINVQYAAEDDTWIGAGKSWTDPVFAKFKFVFTGLQKKGEEKITVSSSADTGDMKLKNSAGKDLTINFWDNDTAVFLGSKFTKANLTVLGRAGNGGSEGDLLVADSDQCIATGSTASALERCEGIQLLVVDSEGQARIYELTDVDQTDSQMTFKDTMNDKSYEVTFANGSNSLDVGLIGDLGVFVNQSVNATGGTGTTSMMLNFTNLNNYAPSGGAIGGFETSLEGAIKLNITAGQVGASRAIQVYLFNETGKIHQWNMTLDSDNDMTIDNIANLGEKESGSDTHVGIDSTNYGAYFEWDSEDKNDLTVLYYGDEAVSGNVYISPIAATVSGAGNVPVVKDTELSDASKTSKNLVVVGGPAVNKLAAELLGKSYPAYGANSGWSADSAVNQLFEGKITPGKVALLVAGYEAKDTQAASKALIAEKKFGSLKTTTASTYSYA